MRHRVTYPKPYTQINLTLVTKHLTLVNYLLIQLFNQRSFPRRFTSSKTKSMCSLVEIGQQVMAMRKKFTSFLGSSGWYPIRSEPVLAILSLIVGATQKENKFIQKPRLMEFQPFLLGNYSDLIHIRKIEDVTTPVLHRGECILVVSHHIL